MLFSAWAEKEGDIPHTFVGGDERPFYGNGAPMEDCVVRVWVIVADSWEEACQEYHRHQGWEPYKPMEEV